MKKILFSCCILLLLFGCTRKGTKVIEVPVLEIPVVSNEVIDTVNITEVIEEEEPIFIPSYRVAVLKKGDCYGVCPEFEVRLFSDGHLTYEGIKDVAMLGLYEAWVDKNSLLDQVKKAAYQIDYFNLSNIYPVNLKSIDELPMTITYLNFDDQEKTIINNHGSPKALRAFEYQLENLLMNVDWKKLGSVK